VVRIAAATNYAARALVELAAAPGELLALPAIAQRQSMSLRFLEHIFRDLRAAGLVTSQRGGHGHGGYRLSVPPEQLTLAAVVAATHPAGSPAPSSPAPEARPAAVDVLEAVWSALEVETQDFLSGVTIADLADGRLPARLGRAGRGDTGAGHG
jgi:Rrf2 family protein